MINLSKKDIWWSYFARFFDVAAGVIILPMILRLLTAEEIGMNYLMLTVGALVTLFDFGFAPQFGRNVTYVLSGAKELKKEGVSIIDSGSSIDYRLLATMIQTARFVYRRLSIVVFMFMVTFGSWYIYTVTDGFTNVENSIYIWLLYSISVFFNIYYSYYSSLLIGKGLISEGSKATVFSRLTYILLAVIFLSSGVGLLGVVLAGLISPFVNRYFSYRYFFTVELKRQINEFTISNKEKYDLFKIIWYNSKKLGIVFICSYASTKFGLFLAGLFLSLIDVASYGLMLQLVGFISGISGSLFGIYLPRFSSLRISGDSKTLIKDFSFSMMVSYLMFISGVVVLIIAGPWALSLIDSSISLPSFWILLLYCLFIFLQVNHSAYATLITTRNDIPFLVPAIISSTVIVVGSFLSLKYTNLDVLGLILILGMTESAYDNWKWPLVVHKEFNINLRHFVNIGLNEVLSRAKLYIHGKRGLL